VLKGHPGSILILPVVHKPEVKVKKVLRRVAAEVGVVCVVAVDSQAKAELTCCSSQNEHRHVEGRFQAQEENRVQNKDKESRKKRGGGF